MFTVEHILIRLFFLNKETTFLIFAGIVLKDKHFRDVGGKTLGGSTDDEEMVQ